MKKKGVKAMSNSNTGEIKNLNEDTHPISF